MKHLTDHHKCPTVLSVLFHCSNTVYCCQELPSKLWHFPTQGFAGPPQHLQPVGAPRGAPAHHTPWKTGLERRGVRQQRGWAVFIGPCSPWGMWSLLPQVPEGERSLLLEAFCNKQIKQRGLDWLGELLARDGCKAEAHGWKGWVPRGHPAAGCSASTPHSCSLGCFFPSIKQGLCNVCLCFLLLLSLLDEFWRWLSSRMPLGTASVGSLHESSAGLEPGNNKP